MQGCQAVQRDKVHLVQPVDFVVTDRCSLLTLCACRLPGVQGIQNSVQANAVKRSPEQLAKALAAAQAELEALRGQLGDAQGSSGGQASTAPAVGGAPGCSCRLQAVGSAGLSRMSSVRKWAVVGMLQLAGLIAYWRAAAELGCMA